MIYALEVVHLENYSRPRELRLRRTKEKNDFLIKKLTSNHACYIRI